VGLFSVRVQVKAPGKTVEAAISALVDTGAAISVVPRTTLARLGIKPLWRRRFVLANGEKIERDVGIAAFRWNGSEGASEVVFGEAGDKPLLGAMTLEALSLKVNPRKCRLEPTELLLL
jgi:clan AA aspartic protease